ncbi:MAG: CDP-diacylglycerol--glycerol-3-phosphate 3-phosphatidyltransferase [uncultured Rubrobacteraceae bacterium]|uniref:CDP-diacylglycerol--glycerol-3-phosphate 3-phosphatidyltransferase n=1 Tax=uncultured Rubrobacteraceae bacterium TaxID=349277 RepID=A0A6J4PWF6_9ACTN|nr:MAG: CDP-diacylglycerol--glycerol-3-phosphate 3-phosphatidyltransferase [uncultured Rubrobacteraceae bacterium]
MNYANQLTLARLIAVVPVMTALYVQFPGNRTVATVLYAAAIFTDYLDGIMARRSGKVTAFGKLMDSIADKAIIVSLFFALVAEGSMPAWMAAIMVVREFAVTGLRMVALESGEVIAANRWGKAKMVTQSLAVFILLLNYSTLGYWVMLLATVLTLLSGWSYLKDTPRILAASAAEQDRERS